MPSQPIHRTLSTPDSSRWPRQTRLTRVAGHSHGLTHRHPHRWAGIPATTQKNGSAANPHHEEVTSVRRDQRGFTLIELVVVITILGVLAALIVPSVGAYTDKAKGKAAEADAKNLQTALILYQAEHGAYPVVSDEWEALRDALKAYLSLPQTPSNFDFQHYTYTDNGTSFTLILKTKEKTPRTITITPEEINIH